MLSTGAWKEATHLPPPARVRALGRAGLGVGFESWSRGGGQSHRDG